MLLASDFSCAISWRLEGGAFGTDDSTRKPRLTLGPSSDVAKGPSVTFMLLSVWLDDDWNAVCDDENCDDWMQDDAWVTFVSVTGRVTPVTERGHE